MNVMSAQIQNGAERRGLMTITGKSPVMLCPKCGAHAITRTSEELSPTTRKLYYRCKFELCGMSWTALLTVENVINPSALGGEIRKSATRNDKPPGHDFGQMTIFDVIPPTSEPAPNRG